MISSLRFGNIHVIEPLVYQRFKDLLEDNCGKNRFANQNAEPNHPAFNFLADATEEEGVREGFSKEDWQCYELPDGKALLLTDLNGGHLRSFRDYRDTLLDSDKGRSASQIAADFLVHLPMSQKVKTVREKDTPGLSHTDVPLKILRSPVYRATLKRFMAMAVPRQVAESWAEKAYDRNGLLEMYMPRMSRVFGLKGNSERQDDFVQALCEVMKQVFGGKFLSSKTSKIAGPVYAQIFKRLAEQGFTIQDTSGYSRPLPSMDTPLNRHTYMQEDLMLFAEQLIREDHPTEFEQDKPHNRLKDYF